MGLLLSVIITYAGFNETVDCLRHILSGVVPEAEPNFQDLVEYYTRLLRKAANRDWTIECGQGYLDLTEDNDGHVKSAAVKFYGDTTNSTALLFSTKISSFGQDSIEDNRANGDYKSERYPTKTKTIVSQSAESFSVGNKKLSPTSSDAVPETNVSQDNNHIGVDNKLTWEYIPKSTSPLPEINFQSYDDKIEDAAYSENYLRSLDGIKFKPLQRNDPSGRRRSFRKRRSSSSNSSKESHASREEELKVFTSLEEEEFRSMSRDNNYTGFGSAPNLETRSYSRSRSRSKETSDETSNSRTEERLDVMHQRSLPRLGSFEEKDEMKAEDSEVNQASEDVDFWSNLAD